MQEKLEKSNMNFRVSHTLYISFLWRLCIVTAERSNISSTVSRLHTYVQDFTPIKNGPNLADKKQLRLFTEIIFKKSIDLI